ncbi:MAG: universal stress protein [Rhizobiaceae bacterium]|nr:universal stress protein [Rhizobiaceae bacterium]
MTKSILLPIDLNQESSWKQALPVALKMAKADDAKLHVLCVIPDYGMAVVGSFFPSDYASSAMADTEKSLTEFVKNNIPAEINAESHAQHGTIYKEILSAADDLKCDLIVMASHRPETKDYLLGPNAARVVRHAKQSVFVVRE